MACGMAEVSGRTRLMVGDVITTIVEIRECRPSVTKFIGHVTTRGWLTVVTVCHIHVRERRPLADSQITDELNISLVTNMPACPSEASHSEASETTLSGVLE